MTKNTSQTLGPRSGAAAYARAIRRYNITYVICLLLPPSIFPPSDYYWEDSTEHLVGTKGRVFRKAAAGGEESEVPADS